MKTKTLSKNNGQGVFSPQEISALQIPGAVQGLPVVAWDHRNNQYGALNQGFLAELCLLAEKVYILDRLDDRNHTKVIIENGAVANDVSKGTIEVPTGEVWYINRLAVVCPAADADGSAKFNIEVTSFPKVDSANKDYLPADVTAMGATTNYDLADPGQLGTDMRLVGGDKLVLRLTVTVDFTADKDFYLRVYGRKGKRLV
ncbi:MAG: hypothetical protein PHQ43_09500 [Dehalococcoidales bacterium]|nr:hypothetical protein [Dehalococcoidales bacterium]